MPIGIRPTVDFAFKCLLGSPEHTSITVHFLNAVLGGRPQIARVEILNPILDKESWDDKLAVLDVLAEDDRGWKFNIEMQTSLPLGLSQRLLYYASCLYVEQLGAGESYVQLRPAISICVLQQAMFPHLGRLHSDFRLRNEQGLVLTDDLQLHLLELSQSRATEHNVREASPLEQWAFFLRHADHLSADGVRQLLPAPAFDEAVGVLEMISRTPDQERRYQARLKFERDEQARLAYAAALAERMRDEGLEQGREVGEFIGQIRLLEQLLGLPVTTVETLAAWSKQELARRVDELRERFNADRN